MEKTSFEFLNEADPIFRRKIDSCFVSVATMLDKYKKHVADTTDENRKNASDFLKEEDPLLEMMVEDFDCHESVIYAMKKYSGATF